MAKEFVLIEKVRKGVMTSADRGVFTNVKIFTAEDGSIVVSLEQEDAAYFADWLARVNGSSLSGLSKARTRIESETGDEKDRISDAFKFCQFLMLAVSDIYQNIDADTPTTAMDADIKTALDDFDTTRTATPELFNIDLKTSLTSEMAKVVVREEAVKDALKDMAAEETT